MKELDNVLIKSLYLDGKNTSELAKFFGVSGETIRCRLHKTGTPIRPRSIRQRKYTCNHSCFSKETPDSFYWAGLLMADGYIKDTNSIAIELQESDSCLIKELRCFTGYTGESKHRTRTQKSGLKSEMETLTICSPQMVSDLEFFGVVSRKSKTAYIPNKVLDHPLVEFYLRGLFDGDGCVGIRQGKHSHGKLYATFGSTPAVIESFRSWCNAKFQKIGGVSKRKPDFWVVNFSYNTVPELGEALYGSPKGPRLDRKASLMLPPFRKAA